MEYKVEWVQYKRFNDGKDGLISARRIWKGKNGIRS